MQVIVKAGVRQYTLTPAEVQLIRDSLEGIQPDDADAELAARLLGRLRP